MNYKDYYGNESLIKEYKIFSLNPILIDEDDALILLKNGKWVFNKSTIQSIKNYLNIYLPKYISSYKNEKSDINYGELYIGIDDGGIIHGIPYKGNLNINFIDYMIDKILINNLKFKNKNQMESCRKDITVEIIEINNLIKRKVNLEYINYNNQINDIIKKQLIYNSKKNIWKKLLNIYTNKLHKMLNNNNLKDDIYEFIKYKTNNEKKKLVNKYSCLYYLCDVPDSWSMIANLKIIDNYKALTFEEIEKIKDDDLNIFNWVTKWKDSKVSLIKKFKPISPKKNIDYSYPMFILSQVSKMIPYWLNKNPKLKLYVLKIKINCINKLNIQYKDILNNKWKTSYRIYKKDGPVSITY